MRHAIERLSDLDAEQVTVAWDAAPRCALPDGIRVALRADLLPSDLLVRRGRLAGVLDRGAAGAGDPVNDLVPAWSCLRRAARGRLRAALGGPDGDRARAGGIALAQALVAIPSCERTNPAFAAPCRATLAEVLEEG